MIDIAGRVALVTGGASGIGRGIAGALADAGARVMIADIDGDAAARAATELGGEGFACDVSRSGDVEALAARLAPLGVSIVVNNAGVGAGAPIAEMTESDWEWTLGINLMGVIHGVRAFLPSLQARDDGGHIVNTASMAALAPTAGLGGYAVSKFGVLALSEVLDAELSAADSAVGVSVLLPGPTRTAIATSQRHRADAGGLVDVDLEKQGFDWIRWIQPDDVGRMVVHAIRTGQRYIVTHPELWRRVEERTERLHEAFDYWAEYGEGERHGND